MTRLHYIRLNFSAFSFGMKQIAATLRTGGASAWFAELLPYTPHCSADCSEAITEDWHNCTSTARKFVRDFLMHFVGIFLCNLDRNPTALMHQKADQRSNEGVFGIGRADRKHPHKLPHKPYFNELIMTVNRQ